MDLFTYLTVPTKQTIRNSSFPIHSSDSVYKSEKKANTLVSHTGFFSIHRSIAKLFFGKVGLVQPLLSIYHRTGDLLVVVIIHFSSQCT